jgi:hypothetical protein
MVKDGRAQQIPTGQSVVSPEDAELGIQPERFGPQMNDPLQEPTKEEESQVDMLLGGILDFVWGDGYDEIKGRMERSPNNLQQTIGGWAGRMVNVEVKSAAEGGVNVSRDILIGVAAEIINAVAEIAKKEKLWKPANDKEEEQFQGEALMYALEKRGATRSANDVATWSQAKRRGQTLWLIGLKQE